MEVVTDPADVTAKAAAGDEGQWSARAGWFNYDKDGYIEWLVGNYTEWTPGNNPLLR
jgi:enediyne biosynthesis protein E4